MQFPIHEYTTGVFEDPQLLGLRSCKSHWLPQRRRKKTHDAIRSLIVLLQPLGLALGELITFEMFDVSKIRHIASDDPEQLLWWLSRFGML